MSPTGSYIIDETCPIHRGGLLFSGL